MTKEELLSNLHNQLSLIGEECKAVLLSVLSGDLGINKKTGTNTLIDSNLFREVGVNTEDYEVVTLLVNDYIEYIENGRAPGSFPPPNAIAAWCQRKGLPSDNSTVFLICRSIYLNGIAPRPIFEGSGGVWEVIESEWENFADEIFLTLIEYLDDFFKD